MKYLNGNSSKSNLDCLLIFVPKLENFYGPIGKHMFCVLLPMGLMAIADLVHRKGYKVQILHLGVEKINNPNFSLEHYLEKTNPKVVGLSLHWHYQCYDTVETARKIKLFNPNIFTVLGGLTASYFHKEAIEEFNFIDAVIRGDGEVPFLDLLERISTGENDLSVVSNLTWRHQNSVRVNEIKYIAKDKDLDELDFTNFKLLNNYKMYIKMQDLRGGRWLEGINSKILFKFGSPAYFPVLINKGCLVNCSYCAGSKNNQKTSCGRDSISIRSTDKVIKSIGEAKEHGFKEIYIAYTPFCGCHDYFKELFEGLRGSGIKIDYFLDCWALPSKEIIKMFKEICIAPHKLYIGISPESGCERIRQLNKGFYYSNEELIQTLIYITSLNIRAILYFSVGLPFETIKDAKETISFQRILKKKLGSFIAISTINPVLEPGSPMFIEPEKYGIIKTRFTFKDFIQANKGIEKSGFITPKLGYFIRGFYNKRKANNLSEEEAFRRELQKTICRSSCRLSDFIFSNLPRADMDLIRGPVSLCSRGVCNMVSLYWKLFS